MGTYQRISASETDLWSLLSSHKCEMTSDVSREWADKYSHVLRSRGLAVARRPNEPPPCRPDELVQTVNEILVVLRSVLSCWILVLALVLVLVKEPCLGKCRRVAAPIPPSQHAWQG